MVIDISWLLLGEQACLFIVQSADKGFDQVKKMDFDNISGIFQNFRWEILLTVLLYKYCFFVMNDVLLFFFHRDTGKPKTGFGAVLPRHNPEHDKRHLETTNRADFKPPYPYTPVPVSTLIVNLLQRGKSDWSLPT